MCHMNMYLRIHTYILMAIFQRTYMCMRKCIGAVGTNSALIINLLFILFNAIDTTVDQVNFVLIKCHGIIILIL